MTNSICTENTSYCRVTSLRPEIYSETIKAGKIFTSLDRKQMLEYTKLNNFGSYV